MPIKVFLEVKETTSYFQVLQFATTKHSEFNVMISTTMTAKIKSFVIIYGDGFWLL